MEKLPIKIRNAHTQGKKYQKTNESSFAEQNQYLDPDQDLGVQK
jgi:hypothetical protein